MKIAAIEIRDFKRIKHIEIQPDADRVLMLIGGQNAQGKSSILDALTMAFGGLKQAPEQPIRTGSDEAYIRVELDDGIVIERVLTADKSHIEVRNADGSTFKSPQAMLDKLVGARFLDPLAFLRLEAKKQRLIILDLADTERRIPALETKRTAAFEERTNLNRDIKNRTPLIAAASAATFTEELKPQPTHTMLEELQKVQTDEKAHRDKQHAHQLAVTGAKANSRMLERLVADMQKLQSEMVELTAEIERVKIQEQKFLGDAAVLHDELNFASDFHALAAEIQTKLSAAETHNSLVQQQGFHWACAAEHRSAVDTMQLRADECTAAINEIDRRKAVILAAAPLPAGLSVADDGLCLHDVPFEQASGAEQFGVALQLAIAANPRLQDVWIRDGALLDDDHLDQLSKIASSGGIRCWVERVGDRDPGAIIIADGMVRQ